MLPKKLVPQKKARISKFVKPSSNNFLKLKPPINPKSFLLANSQNSQKPKSTLSSLDPRHPLYKGKVKRNIVNFNEYFVDKYYAGNKGPFTTAKKLNPFDYKFFKNLTADVESNSISIVRNILNNNPKSAMINYKRLSKNYKNYLLKSEVPVSFINNYMFLFNTVLFRNLVSILKKNIPKRIVQRETKLSKEMMTKILETEKTVAQDLHSLKLIGDKSKLKINYSGYASIDVINDFLGRHNPSALLFTIVTELFNSIKTGEINELLKEDSLGKFRFKEMRTKKGLIKNTSISINSTSSYYKHAIIHEQIHAFLVRDNHHYAKNETFVEFLTNLLNKKHFNKFRRANEPRAEINEPYYVGYLLYTHYENEYGTDLSHLNKFINKYENIFMKYENK